MKKIYHCVVVEADGTNVSGIALVQWKESGKNKL